MKYVCSPATTTPGASQMAQAFFERSAPPDVRAESAGRHPRRDGVCPNVVEAMLEARSDLSRRRPTKRTVEMQLHADWAITLAWDATCPYVPSTVEHWDIPDPAGLTLAETRTVRDAIELRVEDLVEDRLDAIRADRTAHQHRLEHLPPELAREFEGVRSEADMRACADAILSEFADVPIGSHVMAIAHRKACECLRAERCGALA